MTPRDAAFLLPLGVTLAFGVDLRAEMDNDLIAAGWRLL